LSFRYQEEIISRRMNDSANLPPAKPRHIWPWIIVALVLLGVILSVLGIRGQMQQVREQRQMQMPSPTQ
jgi:hypothetical protein